MAQEKPLTIADLLKVKVRIFFAPLGREMAVGQAQAGVLLVDPRPRIPGAKILLHELIHVKRPLWREWRVLQEESRLWNNATWQEKAELYRLLGKGKVWEGEQEFEDGETDVQGRGEVGQDPAPNVGSTGSSETGV